MDRKRLLQIIIMVPMFVFIAAADGPGQNNKAVSTPNPSISQRDHGFQVLLHSFSHPNIQSFLVFAENTDYMTRPYRYSGLGDAVPEYKFRIWARTRHFRIQTDQPPFINHFMRILQSERSTITIPHLGRHVRYLWIDIAHLYDPENKKTAAYSRLQIRINGIVKQNLLHPESEKPHRVSAVKIALDEITSDKEHIVVEFQITNGYPEYWGIYDLYITNSPDDITKTQDIRPYL